MEKSHRHLIVRARVSNPPTDQAYVEQWMKDIVHAVGMKVLMGPISSYSNIPGNEGITALVALDFSHASIHIWDKYKSPLVEFDLFSCKKFDINVVIDKIKEFGVKSIGIQYLNRDARFEGEFCSWEKIYVVYKTTNTINGKYYIGVHGFTDIADGYLGSGKLLRKAITKYGKEAFQCEHLRYFDNAEDAYAYENMLVTPEVVKEERTYNVAVGGKGCARCGGAFDRNCTGAKRKHHWITNGNESTLYPSNEAIPEGWYKGRKVSDNFREKMSKRLKGKPSPRKEKPASEQQKQRASETLKKRYKIMPHHSKGKKRNAETSI